MRSPQLKLALLFLTSALTLCFTLHTLETAAALTQQLPKPTKPRRLIVQVDPAHALETEELLGLQGTDSQEQPLTKGRARTTAQRRLQQTLSKHHLKQAKRLHRRAHGRAARRDARLERRAKRAPAGLTPPVETPTYVLELDPTADPEQAARELSQEPGIRAVPDQPVTFDDWLPNEPLLAEGANGTLWDVYALGLPAAWDLAKGDDVLVAVIDTGVTRTHPDIAANIWVNDGEDLNHNAQVDAADFNDVDDDGNGYFDDVWGWDFVWDDNDPSDNNDPSGHDGHGTHVAGTVAAIGDNGRGIVGVAPHAKVMVLKVADASQDAQAIRYATDMGADVINASWGSSPFGPLAEALAYAASRGVVVVSSAGNDNGSADAKWPCADPWSLCVSATDRNNEFTAPSNFGESVDVGAPGKEITSLAFNFNSQEETTVLSGTSQASPHVAGVAALLLSKTPSLTIEQIRQLLWATADDIEAEGWDPQTGFGLLQADTALLAQPPVLARFTNLARAQTLLRPLLASELDVQGSILDQPASGAQVSGWQLTLSPDGSTESPQVLASGAGPQAESTLVTVPSSTLGESGRGYTLHLEATATNGQVSSDIAKVRVVEPVWQVRQITNTPATPSANFYRRVCLSRDGQLALIASSLPLDPALDRADTSDSKLFLYHRATQAFEFLVRFSAPATFSGFTLSGDGSTVAFISNGDFDPAVGNPSQLPQLFWMDVASHTVHQATSPVDWEVSRDSPDSPVLSNDRGTRIVFEAIKAGWSTPEIALYERGVGVRQLTDGHHNDPNNFVRLQAFSHDGRIVVYDALQRFLTTFTPLPVHRYDLERQQDLAVPQDQCLGSLFLSSGRSVLISADGSRLVCEQPDFTLLEYTGSTFNVLVRADGLAGLGESRGDQLIAASDDASQVLFLSARNLDPLRGNPASQAELFIWDTQTQGVTQVTYQPSSSGQSPFGSALDGAGQTIAATVAANLDWAQGGNADGSDELFLLSKDPQALQLTAVPAQEVQEGEQLQFTVRAFDPNGKSISWIAYWATGENRPLEELGASFVDHGDGTGTLTWLPWYDDAGYYEVAFLASTLSGRSAAFLVPIRVLDVGTRDFTLFPTDDTYVDVRKLDKNFGTSKRLKVRYDGDPGRERLPYFKFSLTTLTQTFGSSSAFDIVKARLRVYSSSKRLANVMMDARQMSPTWNEMTLTYRLHTALSAIPGVPFFRGPTGQVNWHEVDVTWADFTGQDVSFRLEDVTSGFSYVSKEFPVVTGTRDFRPQLLLAVAPREAPPTSFDFVTFEKQLFYTSGSAALDFHQTGHVLPEAGEMTVSITTDLSRADGATLLLKAFDADATGEGTVAVNGHEPMTLPTQGVAGSDQEARLEIPLPLGHLQQGLNTIRITHTSGDGFEIRALSLRLHLPAQDFTPPIVALTAPASPVRGTVELSATATDSQGVDRVEFFASGKLLVKDTTAPYTASWNTTFFPNGSQTLEAHAYDRSGNQGDAVPVTVVVDNPVNAPGALSLSGTYEAASGMSVRLQWADRSTNETGFEIERSTSPTSGFTRIASVAANATTYTDLNRPAGAFGYYRVRAVSGPTVSGYSNTVGINTMVASADTFVSSANPSQTPGTRAELGVSATNPTKWSYLKFSTPALAGKLLQANLRLGCIAQAGCGTGGTLYKLTNTSWSEATLSYSLALVTPGLVPSSGTSLGAIPTASYTSWLAQPVASSLAASGSVVSYAISTTNANLALYSSREGTAPPHLILVVEPGP